MHIVHVLSSMAIGGQERVALDLARGLIKRNHRVTAVSFVPGGALLDEFRREGAQVVELVKGGGVDVRLFSHLLAALRGLRADVVHTHNPQPLIYAAPTARLLGVRAVVHTKHGANPDSPRRVALRRVAARLCGAYVAVSDQTAQVAREVDRVQPPRLMVVHNGIDLSRFAPDVAVRAAVRAELGIPESAFVFGTVGRLSKEKAQGDLIAALGHLRALCGSLSGRRQELRLVVVGDGSERERLEQLAGEVDGQRVHLLGARSDVPRLLQALDVFCLSSVTEGLPLVIPEAMATGLPVVATAVGGVPSVVMEGETGFLVPVGEPQVMAERLARLLREPALRARLGEVGRCRALKRYDLSRMVDEYEGIYQRLVSSDAVVA